MFINITQEDIDKGERSKSSKCPLALAAHRSFSKEVYIDVLPERIYVHSGDATRLTKYNLPPIAQNFVISFDLHNPVEPIMFEIVPVGEQ